MVALNILKPYAQQMSHDLQAAYVDYCVQQMREREDKYRIYREYYDGDHDVQFIDRLKAFIGAKAGINLDFSVNYCPMVVQAKASRLNIKGFKTEDDSSKTFETWWQKNRMDALQGIVHLAAIRDADTFVLVEWDKVAKMPRYTHEKAYCGHGVMVHYSDERANEIKFASKQWIINYGEHTGKQRRLNLYLPNRIERYMDNDEAAGLGQWLPYLDESDPTVFLGDGVYGKAGISWWTRDGTEFGEPLGIPIIHFKDNDSGDCYGNGLLGRVIPLQDALNKTEIDLLAAMDVEGFGLMVGYGANWEGVRVGPGALVHTQKPKTEAQMERLAGSNPVGMLAVKSDIVMDIARVTGTPLSYLQSTGQIASADTLKQQETALVAGIKKAQVDFGNAWEDCLNMGRKLFNVFGNGTLSEEIIIETIWDSAESRNDKEETETLAIQVEKIGVSQDKAQEKLGYDAEDREAFAREKMKNEAKMIQQQQAQSATAKEAMPNAKTMNAQNNSMTENEANNGNGSRASPA